MYGSNGRIKRKKKNINIYIILYLTKMQVLYVRYIKYDGEVTC